jgi:transcriptional regulator with XRE-family HTH domain
MASKTKLADRIKEARVQRGLSQAQLAAMAGVRQSAIGNLEAGIRKSTHNVLEIARALGVRPEWLQDGIGSREAKAVALRPEVVEIAEKINSMPAEKLAAIRTLVDALGPAVPDERVAQFIKPAGSK